MSNLNKVTGPISAIIVTLILTLGLLIATGAVFPEPKTYATVNFDGGWKKLGVLSEERIYIEIEITRNGSNMYSANTMSDIKAFLSRQSEDTGGVEKTTFREGVVINASAGIEWTGSESNFKLSTHNLSLASTAGAPIYFSAVLSSLEELEANAKLERQKNSIESLSYSEKSKEAGYLDKLLAIFS